MVVEETENRKQTSEVFSTELKKNNFVSFNFSRLFIQPTNQPTNQLINQPINQHEIQCHQPKVESEYEEETHVQSVQ